ncbi:MAG: outer membrane beta-barrel domain-containing protein [Oligoflexia bacterium]|nr:outer membrane beta-barrel domain-containing protein [Oligoflexia bacterium]
MLWKVVTFFLVIANFMSAAHAADDDYSTGTPDEYDFSWLDPDKKIYVVQNRKYLKKGRLELALSGGVGIGEPYRKRRIFLPRAFFYINETWAVSALAGFNSNSENDNFVALKTVSSVVPAVRDVQSFYGGSIVWLPFYGKINIFNQILYIDWHFELGVGQASTEIDLNTSSTGNPRIQESSHFSFHWGTGQKFFITRNFAARLDYLAMFYKAPTGLNGNFTTALGATEETYDNHYVTLGLSYTF